jgi:hypothetical protein
MSPFFSFFFPNSVQGGCSYRWQGKDKLKTQAQIRNYGLVSGWVSQFLIY